MRGEDMSELNSGVKVIGLIKVIDTAAFEDYRNQVGATVALYGGQIVSRGKVLETAWSELGGEPFDAIVELLFPSDAAAHGWMTSPEYSRLLEVRSKAMRLTLFSVS
jgi:uncharacterized protein (DUF1330 family)